MLVTEANWRSTLKYQECKTCSGTGAIHCEICKQDGEHCECTKVPRAFVVCPDCDGEGNDVQVPEGKVH